MMKMKSLPDNAIKIVLGFLSPSVSTEPRRFMKMVLRTLEGTSILASCEYRHGFLLAKGNAVALLRKIQSQVTSAIRVNYEDDRLLVDKGSLKIAESIAIKASSARSIKSISRASY